MSFFFPHTCTIRRRSDATSGTTGGSAPTFADTAGITCGLQVKRTSQINQPSEAGETQAFVFFPLGTDVRASDELLAVPGYDQWIWAVSSDPVNDPKGVFYTRVEVTHKTGQVSK